MINQHDLTKIQEAISEMESKYQMIQQACIQMNQVLSVWKKAEESAEDLLEWYQSDQWMEAYELDENGQLPASLKRGCLSQDGIYNLLEEMNELKQQMQEIACDSDEKQ